MALANSVPRGVGARRLNDLRGTGAWRRLRIAGIGLLMLHWLGVSLTLIVGVHLPADLHISLPAGPVTSFLFWWIVVYIVALPLMMPAVAWVWIRTTRAAVSERVDRWVVPTAIGLYAVHAAYYVPFMTTLD